MDISYHATVQIVPSRLVITARVRSTMGGFIIEFVFQSTGRGGGIPNDLWSWSLLRPLVPCPLTGEWAHPSSLWSRVLSWEEVAPVMSQNKSTPSPQPETGQGYHPYPQTHLFHLHSDTEYMPMKSPVSHLWTAQTIERLRPGSTPLAVTQEDFLIYKSKMQSLMCKKIL